MKNSRCCLLLLLLALLFAACSSGGGDDDDHTTVDDADDDDTADDDADDDVDDDLDDDDTGDDDLDDDTSDDDTGDDDTLDDDTADDDTTDDDAADDDTATQECPAVITRQPYLQLASQTGMSVLWRTDVVGDSLVEYGLTEDLGNWVYDGNMVTKHELAITGLQPGTTYYYKVVSCQAESTVGTFRTAPEPGDPFTFVAFSDNQENFDIFGQIAGLMLAEDPWLAISSGDTVNDGWNEPDFDEQLFGPAADVWRQAPLYPAIGNHEHLSPYFYSSFHFPNGDTEYYSFTFGNVFFIGLALDTVNQCIPGFPQYRFFKEALASDEAQNAEFRVVFFHTPPWTEGWEGYNGEELVRWFVVPLMEEYGVDVYFNGHTHDFERGLLNGVTSYIIGGAGGGLDYWVRDVEHITVYNAVHHFMSVQVDGNQMTLNAIDIDGNTFDTWVITH